MDFDRLSWSDIARFLNVGFIRCQDRQEEQRLFDFVKGKLIAHGEKWVHEHRYEIRNEWNFYKRKFQAQAQRRRKRSYQPR